LYGYGFWYNEIKVSEEHEELIMNKKSYAVIGLFICACCILALFWYNEVKISKRDEELHSMNEQTEVGTKVENPIVTIEMANGGKIVIELYPEVAPNTVANFVSLVQAGFYDGTIFHRVIPGFMIQGGDPTGTGTGGPGYSIKGEFANNNFKNDLAHEVGVISMARSQLRDSAGSQFFIMVEKSPHLDGEYAGFGRVIEGMDVVSEIVNANRNAADKPLADQVMAHVTVDTFGKDYQVTKM